MTLHLRPSSIDDSRSVTFRQKPDGDRDPAGETGWFVQRERERRGKSLADAALETHISARYLHAIEMGTLRDLPSRSYVLGYVRVYAEFLGLEAEPLVQQYQMLLAESGARRVKPGGGFAHTMMLTAASLVFLIAMTAVVWYLMPGVYEASNDQAAANLPGNEVQRDGTIQTGSVDTQSHGGAAADRIAEMLDDAVPTVVVRQEGFADGDRAGAPADDSLQPDDMAAVAPAGEVDPNRLTEFILQHVTDPVSSDEDGGTRTAHNGVEYGSENHSVRIVLHANKAVWIRVEDAEGRIMITRTLQAGDSYRVPDRAGLVLIARDGGALDYSIDGERRGAIGAAGEIVVGRPLDAGQLSRT
jgi:cytoskeleton protein RodZ